MAFENSSYIVLFFILGGEGEEELFLSPPGLRSRTSVQRTVGCLKWVGSANGLGLYIVDFMGVAVLWCLVRNVGCAAFIVRVRSILFYSLYLSYLSLNDPSACCVLFAESSRIRVYLCVIEQVHVCRVVKVNNTWNFLYSSSGSCMWRSSNF